MVDAIKDILSTSPTALFFRKNGLNYKRKKKKRNFCEVPVRRTYTPGCWKQSGFIEIEEL